MKYINKLFGLYRDEGSEFLYLLGRKINLRYKRDMFSLLNKKLDSLIGFEDDLNRIIQNNISTALMHKETFTPYKNIYNNREIVILATGKSANKYKTPIKNAIHIGVNRAIQMGINLDYIFIQDHYGMKDYIQDIIDYNPESCQKFFGITCEYDRDNVNRVIPESYAIRANAKRYRTDWEKISGFKHRFMYDISANPLCCHESIVFPAIQFALWTNPKRIYLVGCDCVQNGYFDDKNQEFPFSESRVFEGWKKLKSFKEIYYPDTEIVSINPVGLKGLFKDYYIKDELSFDIAIKTKQIDELEILRQENKNLLANYKNYTPICEDNKAKVYLLNDCTYNRVHAGCNIVKQNIVDLCNKNNMNIVYFDSTYKNKQDNVDGYENIISKSDLILFNGEGSLHSSNGVNMLEKCRIAKNQGKKLFLINSTWQNNEETNDYLEYFDLIYVRESKSYDEIPQQYKSKTLIVPDLCFYNELKIDKNDKNKKMIFTDSVKPGVTNFLKDNAEKHNFEFYYMQEYFVEEDKKYLTEEDIAKLTHDSLIVTGRFHALVFALKYRIPVYAIPSNTFKIEGLLKDAGLEEFIINNSTELEDILNNHEKYDYSSYYEKSKIYSDRAKILIEKMFVDISNITNGEQ